MRLALFTDSFAPQQNGVSRTLERLVRETEDRGGEARVFTVDDPRAPRSRNGHVRRAMSVAMPHDPGIRSSLFCWRAVFDDLFAEYELALAGRDPVRVPSPRTRRSGVFSHAPR